MNKHRFLALDGIRGLAALLVIFYHSDFNINQIEGHKSIILITRLLAFAAPFAVNLFFILCGFLMTFYYSDLKKPMAFIAKRYLRIFPLFIILVTFDLVKSVYPKSSVWFQLSFLINLAFIVNLCWRKAIENQVFKRPWFNRLIKIFIFCQLLMIPINYLFSHPQINLTVFLSQKLYWPIVYLANLTLTLFAGWNIPILNGPYWSLAPEIYFYLLFPSLVVPLIHFLEKRKPLGLLLFLLVSFAFFQGLNFVFNQLIALSRLNINRSYGFVLGISLAVAYQSKSWLKLSRLIKSNILNIVILFFIPLALYWLQLMPKLRQDDPFHGLTAFLALFVLMAALGNKSLVNRFFSFSWFRFLGLISYPIYLSHKQVIDTIKSSFHLYQAKDFWLLMFLSMLFIIPVACFLHLMAERPYFLMKKNHTRRYNKIRS